MVGSPADALLVVVPVGVSGGVWMVVMVAGGCQGFGVMVVVGGTDDEILELVERLPADGAASGPGLVVLAVVVVAIIVVAVAATASVVV